MLGRGDRGPRGLTVPVSSGVGAWRGGLHLGHAASLAALPAVRASRPQMQELPAVPKRLGPPPSPPGWFPSHPVVLMKARGELPSVVHKAHPVKPARAP